LFTLLSPVTIAALADQCGGDVKSSDLQYGIGEDSASTIAFIRYARGFDRRVKM